jgi:hypothetical protein
MDRTTGTTLAANAVAAGLLAVAPNFFAFCRFVRFPSFAPAAFFACPQGYQIFSVSLG